VKLVVGLGNPGKAYGNTRHNAGFLVLDELAKRNAVRFKRGWFSSAHTVKVVIGEEPVLLARPLTFMNHSGQAVAGLMRKRSLTVEDLIVVLDDVELAVGQVRVRRQGGAGGHNGLQSVIEHLGTREFARVRVGVGPRPAGEDLVDYVLGKFSRGELEKMMDVVKKAADAVENIIEDGLDSAMNRFNQKQREGGNS